MSGGQHGGPRLKNCRGPACRSVTSMSRNDRSEKRCVPSLLWVHIFPCGCKSSTCTCLRHDEDLVATKRRGCKFSHVGASFQLALPRQDEILSPQRDVGASLSHVGASFQLALAFDTMKILSPQRDVGASFPMWVRVFNLHFLDTMKILSPQREVGASLPMWVRVSNLHLPSTR